MNKKYLERQKLIQENRSELKNRRGFVQLP